MYCIAYSLPIYVQLYSPGVEYVMRTYRTPLYVMSVGPSIGSGRVTQEGNTIENAGLAQCLPVVMFMFYGLNVNGKGHQIALHSRNKRLIIDR